MDKVQRIDLASQVQAFRIKSIIKQSLAFPFPAFLFRQAGDLCFGTVTHFVGFYLSKEDNKRWRTEGGEVEKVWLPRENKRL